MTTLSSPPDGAGGARARATVRDVAARFGGDPAVVCAIGMLSGFCGTLLTPLAANFNLVPAALLQLKDRYGVIRAQAWANWSE